MLRARTGRVKGIVGLQLTALTFPFRVPLAAVAVRAAVALAAAFAFAVPLFAALHTRVPPTRHRPLFEPQPSDRVAPFEIGGFLSSYQDVPIEIHRARLFVQDVPALTSHPRIVLTVATFRTVPRLIRAELSFAGTACAYRTADTIEIADNYPVVFHRDDECSTANATGDATLVFRLRNRARIALVAIAGDSPPPRDALVLASPVLAEARFPPILQGDTVDISPGTGATRIDLLGYMWEIRPGTRWLDAAIAACGVLVGCAVFLAWPTPPVRRFVAARQTVAAFMAAFAVSASYAVLCPPFQVADESSHFLALTSFLGRPALGEQATEWARRGMFEEIRFHPLRTFSPLDRGASGLPWSEISVPIRDLYGAVRVLWRLVGHLVSNMDLQHTFLTVRLFHAAVFALAAALFVLFVRSFTGRDTSVSAALPLFLVPTLPLFGMHVSNYAPLVAAYTLVGAGIVIASWDGPRSWAAGPILGFGLGAAIGMSRSALPLLPLIAAVLAARAVLGDREGHRRAAWAFWAGFTLLLAGMLLFIRTPYTVELDVYGGLVAPPVTAFTVLLRQPWLLLPFGAAGLMSEHLLTRVRGRLVSLPHHAAVRWIALGAAISVFVLFAASLLVPYPTLPLYPPPPHRPPAAQYVREALLACVTFLRFGRPDRLTSVTFFAGFGWLDMIPPLRLVAWLAGASGVMLVLLLLWVAQARSTRTLIWLGFAAAGFVASAAAYGLSIARAVPYDLHGRYLVGLYLCALAVCWTGFGRAAGSPSSARQTTFAAVALAFGIAVNVYSLRLILVRYFS
jgi:hypothetical protein